MVTRLALCSTLLLAALAPPACVPTLERCGPAGPGASLECPLPDDFDRGASIRVPSRWDGVSALPVIVALHGGGGNRASAETVTCPDGEAGGARCLSRVANEAGYALVLPDGTGLRPTRNVRSWNAGGGVDGWLCVSKGACQEGVDDAAFFDRLLAEVARVFPIDRRRVFVTGLSNGAAMAHRLACERPDVVAAVVAVGGGNQLVAAGGRCEARVPVLQIHGADDPCWHYETSSATCSFLDEGRKIGADETVDGWRARNGCSASYVDETLPDAAADGTTATRRTWAGCAAAVERIRIDGGGHTWPGGHGYLDEETIGRVSRDFEANVELVRFFDAHPKP